MGKTAVALSMAAYPAIQQGIPIGIFSLEMSKEQLTGRLESQLSKVNVSNIVKKKLTENEIMQIEGLAKDLNEAPIYIDDTPALSLLEFKGKARKMVKEQNVKLLIIDYLQLMRSGTKTQSREQEIAEISRGLKAIAKELNVPVVALAQLSRSVEARGGDKKPMLQDLRESGQIEQDADMVMFCYRPEYYGIEDYEAGGETFDTNGLFMLLVAKHRNGELGEIPLTFIHENTRVKNHESNFGNQSNSNNNRTFVQQDNSTPMQGGSKAADEGNYDGMKKMSWPQPGTEFEKDSNDDFSKQNDEDELPF
jgi:replicative DNA helicase